MEKIVKIIIITGIFIFLTRSVYGQSIAGQSAKINYIKKNSKAFDLDKYIQKKQTIKNILKKYNSPLINNIDQFINSCINNNLNCYLLPAITGVESTFGQSIYPVSYNPFGWGGGTIIFKDFDEAISTVSSGLRINYLNKGAKTIEDIGKIYAESKVWPVKVKYFIAMFEKEEKNVLFLNQNQVEL